MTSSPFPYSGFVSQRSWFSRARSVSARILVVSSIVGVATGRAELWVTRGAAVASLSVAAVSIAALVRHLRASGERSLIVGDGVEVERAVRLFDSYAALGVRPVATATPDGLRPTSLDGGSLEDIRDLIEALAVTHVINVSAAVAPKLERILGRGRPDGVRLSAIQPLGELLTAQARVVDVRGTPFLTLGPRRAPGGPRWVAKRSFDYAFAAVGLVVVSPILGLAALALRLEGGGPVLFRQSRVGRNGKAFEMLKFRTLRRGGTVAVPDWTEDEEEPAYFDVTDDPRLTRVGRRLRRFAIDELPLLVNVLRGEMSVVGPRPYLQHEMDADPESFEWRSHFLPGITGPWQVAGRSWIPRREGLRMDLAYMEHWGFRLDMAMISRTVGVVLRNNRRPAYEHTHVVPDEPVLRDSPRRSFDDTRSETHRRRGRTKLLVAASAGGHARDLDGILSVAAELWPMRPSVYVTTSQRHADSARRPGLDVFVIREADRRTILRGVRSAMQSLRIILRERPTHVVTTGAMPMAVLCLWARAVGAKVVWIDCISQTEKLSLSARLVKPLTNLMLTQWPNVAEADAKTHYAGRSVLIFLTVGSRLGFDRLVRAVDDMVALGIIREPITAQIGNGRYEPKFMSFDRMISASRYDELMLQADRIIGHAGSGTIAHALENDKPLLVLPRLGAYGEHVNDHQVATAATFARLGCILRAEQVHELPSCYRAMRNFVPRRRIARTHDLVDRIGQFLANDA